jgi:hypothetical protein
MGVAINVVVMNILLVSRTVDAIACSESMCPTRWLSFLESGIHGSLM